jgi:hypothetical protein
VSRAIVGQASLDIATDGTSFYQGEVVLNIGTPQAAKTSVVVPVNAGDSNAVLLARINAAIDAEAVKMGFAAPTEITGPSFVKYR